jgi:hypothetical protein
MLVNAARTNLPRSSRVVRSAKTPVGLAELPSRQKKNAGA